MSRSCIASLAGLVLVSSAAIAGPQVKFLNVNAWGGSSSGGPFELQAIGFTPVGLNLVGATQADSFITFCIERDEYIKNGETYDVAFNTAAVSGGSGGPNPDPLDARSAFLYTMFIKGTLSTIESGFTYNQASSGFALQDAFWYIEEEIGSLSAGSLAQALVDSAQSAIDANSWSGIGNVRVLNLTRNGEGRQDQLVLIPLPTAASMGFFGLAFISARRRR